MTYWGQHDTDGVRHTGFARYGDRVADGVVLPFQDEEADKIAQLLGMEARKPDDDAELGTTFCVIDPVVDPTDLVRAIERNWWPAIEDDQLTATVIDGEESLIPRPRRDPVLRPFIEGYDLALSPPDNQVAERKRTKLSPYEADDGVRYELGSLGLVAEPGGWSYAVGDPDGDDVGHRSLVALVRGPRMIVEYLEAGMTRPYVRGVFVADETVDDLLRQTEPKAHDAWQARLDEGGVDPVAPEIARTILERVRRNVNDFRKSLKPPPRPAEDIRLPELERLFRSLFLGKGTESTLPARGERPFSIKVAQSLVEDERPMHIRLTGSVRIALTDDLGAPRQAKADLTLSYRFVEEGGLGEEARLTVQAPPEFEQISEQPSTFRGTVSHDYVEFEFVSQEYPADWTGKLKIDANLLQGVLLEGQDEAST
jgi:hypothetical protein